MQEMRGSERGESVDLSVAHEEGSNVGSDDDDAPDDVVEWLQQVKRPWSPRRRLSQHFLASYVVPGTEDSIPAEEAPQLAAADAPVAGEASIFDDDSQLLTYAKTRRSDLMNAAHEAADQRLKQARNPIAEFQECFELIDIDKSGTIDVQELKFAFEVLGQTDVNLAQCQRFINEWDKDMSGSIDFEEFVEVMATNGMMGSQTEVHGVPIEMRLAELRRKQLLREVITSYTPDPRTQQTKARETNLSHLVTQPGDEEEAENAKKKQDKKEGGEGQGGDSSAQYGPQRGADRQRARKEREASRLERELARRSTMGYSGSTRGGVAAREAAKHAIQKVIMDTITRETRHRRKNVQRRIKELERARGILPMLESSYNSPMVLGNGTGTAESMLLAARNSPELLAPQRRVSSGRGDNSGTEGEYGLLPAIDEDGRRVHGGAMLSSSVLGTPSPSLGLGEDEEPIHEVDVFLEGAAVDWPNAQLLPSRAYDRDLLLPKYLTRRSKSAADVGYGSGGGGGRSPSPGGRRRDRSPKRGGRNGGGAGSPRSGFPYPRSPHHSPSRSPTRPVSNMGEYATQPRTAAEGFGGGGSSSSIKGQPSWMGGVGGGGAKGGGRMGRHAGESPTPLLEGSRSEPSLGLPGARSEWGRPGSKASAVRVRQEQYAVDIRHRLNLPVRSISPVGHRALGPRPYSSTKSVRARP